MFIAMPAYQRPLSTAGRFLDADSGYIANHHINRLYHSITVFFQWLQMNVDKRFLTKALL